jgi:hypothetical protein
MLISSSSLGDIRIGTKCSEGDNEGGEEGGMEEIGDHFGTA